MPPGQRKRAPQACVTCHTRRVKCDVIKRSPCTNCTATNATCKIRESRRGKHVRNPRKNGKEGINDSRAEETFPASNSPRQSSPSLVDSLTTAPSPGSSGAITDTADDHALPNSNTTCLSPSYPCSTQRMQPARAAENQGPPTLVTLPQAEMEGINYPLGMPHRNGNMTSQNGCAKSPTNTHTVFSTSLNAGAKQTEEAMVFMGESTSISYLHDAHPSPSKTEGIESSLFPIPEIAKAQHINLEWEAERTQAKRIWLQATGALSFPSSLVVEKLLEAYFQWFHPCFAILDEPEIWSQYRQSTLSPLLLQAILFISVMHCNEEELSLVNLGSRHRAKYILYNRAKDLFDAEFESKSIIAIQALFLMSFWRAGALSQKDTRYWLGATVSLAQTKALHRRLPSQSLSSQPRKLQKRLWWSIYIREQQCAAALGLPSRILDDDCDLETLDEQDFEFSFNPSKSPEERQISMLYMKGMAELSQILGRIIYCNYSPSGQIITNEREKIQAYISNWKSNPDNIVQAAAAQDNRTSDFYLHMINLAYNNLLLLFYRPGCNRPNIKGDDLSMRMVRQASSQNTLIIENMVVDGLMHHAQIHVITSVFNTLCAHTLFLRNSEGSQRFVSENRAKTCLLGLRELQKTWEVRNWILQLFFQYLEHPIAARLQIDAEICEPKGVQTQATLSQNVPTHNSDVPQIEVQEHEAPPPCIGTWPLSVDDASSFLHSQIENNFTNNEASSANWYMADFFGAYLPS